MNGGLSQSARLLESAFALNSDNPQEKELTNEQAARAILERQRFDSHREWVNFASRVLTAHPRYNEGADWSEPNPFKAICFDAQGRHCQDGGDFRRADEEDAFPVRWLWPDQIGIAALAALGEG